MSGYLSLEGLPALGKSELLAALRLFFPRQVLVLPELVKEVGNREGLNPFRDRDRLNRAILAALPERQAAVRAALSQGLTVVEESHLGVHAAYCAALGDDAFLSEFARLEGELLWPEQFLHLAAPIEVSLARQAVRGEPQWAVGREVLSKMLSWLSSWHARRGSEVVPLDADRPPQQVLADLTEALGLAYRSLPYGEVLPYLILLGRPAAGKSELIQFLKGLPPDERAERYHLGTIAVLDDFPILWEKFIEDDIWEKVGKGRLISARAEENYYVTDDYVWPFLIERLNQVIEGEALLPGRTLLVEFSRGGEGAYRKALANLSRRALEQGAILYLSVSFEESWRRNQARYDRDKRDGILTHAVPWEEMERTYRTDDWAELAPEPQGYLEVEGIRVPYITVENEPEPLTPEDFADRFRPALEALYKLWKKGK